GKTEVSVYVLQNADADEVAKSLNALAVRAPQVPGRLAPPRSMLTGTITVTSDKTRNALIIAASPEDHATLAELIAKLDVKRRQEGKINVYPLQYAEAEDLAKTLTTLFARPLVAAAQTGPLAALSVPLTGQVTVTAAKA